MNWLPVPNLPHVQYAAVNDAYGRYFIHFRCLKCQDVSRKQCSNPARTNYWVLVYAGQHGHGMGPLLG